MDSECNLAGKGYPAAGLGHGHAPDVRAELRSRLCRGSGLEALAALGKLSAFRSSGDCRSFPDLSSKSAHRGAGQHSSNAFAVLGFVRTRRLLHIRSRGAVGLPIDAADALSHLDVARNDPRLLAFRLGRGSMGDPDPDGRLSVTWMEQAIRTRIRAGSADQMAFRRLYGDPV